MLIAAAILAIFVYGMIAAMAGTILPELAKVFDLAPEQSGFVLLAQGLGLAVSSVSVGPLIDNKGKKTGLLLGLGLVAACLYALPNSTGYAMMTATFFLLGVGGGIIVTGANTLVSDVGQERRATLMNFLNLFFGLGGMATPFVAANVFGGDMFKVCYLTAVLTSVTFIVHVFAPIPPPTGERGFKFAEAGRLLSQPALYLLAIFLFLYIACEVGVWNWLPSHLQAQGVSAAESLNILSLGFALGLLIGRVAVAPILIKVRPETVTLGAAVLMAITCYTMLQGEGTTAAWISVFCAGVAMAPVFPTTLAMVGNAFPKATATAMGIVITCGWIGLVVSSPIIGGIAGDDPAGLKTALLVLPAAAVLMIIVNIILRPVLKKAQEA
jgi:fucose permease